MADPVRKLTWAADLVRPPRPDTSDPTQETALAARARLTTPETRWHDLTHRMKALDLQQDRELEHKRGGRRPLPRRRFEAVFGEECKRLNHILSVCGEASAEWHRVEWAMWLTVIQSFPVDGLPHPVWISRARMWNFVGQPTDWPDHGDEGCDEATLRSKGVRPFGGAPVDAAEPWRPTPYAVVEIDGIPMAIPINEERRDHDAAPIQSFDD